MVHLEATVDNGLAKVYGVDTFQIRSISETRLVKKLGQLSDLEMQLVSQALAMVLNISHPIF